MLPSARQIEQAVGCSASTAARWETPLRDTCRAFEITTPKRIAAFLAQLGHESAGLSVVVENLNYSAAGLLATWPSRFTHELAEQLARKPERIANHVYASRMGNGDEASGDGWRYRGRGPIQITGRANYAAIRDALRETGRQVPDFELSPDLLADPKWGALAAGAFWAARSLNDLADVCDFRKITTRINGGQNGAADRSARYAAALKVFG